MTRDRPGCYVCDQTNRSFACASCINNSLLAQPHALLKDALRRRDEVLSRLEALLVTKTEHNVRQLPLQRQRQRTRVEGCRAADTAKRLAAARQEVESLTAANNGRRSRCEHMSASLAASRAKVLGSDLPWAIRYQDLTYKHLHSKVLLEQRCKLKQLLDILPIRISAITGAGAGGSGFNGTASSPVQITVCNLKLPDSLATSTLAVLQPEAASSALGYTLLFLDLISSYLGGPLLHEGSFQGSTTVLWQQQSFWNRRPSSSNGVLPLFVEEAGGRNIGLGAKPRTSAWAPPPIARALTAVGSPPDRLNSGGSSGSFGAGSGGSGSSERPLDEALLRQRNADLKLAYDLLQRSISCFVRDKAPALGLRLPPSWSPFGWLVVLCAVVRKDESTAGVVAAAQSMAQVPEDVLVRGEGQAATAADDADEPEDLDGWDVVHVPPMPPPPSQPDEVEQWTRAMFTDANLSSQPLPTERVRSLFGR